MYILFLARKFIFDCNSAKTVFKYIIPMPIWSQVYMLYVIVYREDFVTSPSLYYV
jgi:hypothetical protein